MCQNTIPGRKEAIKLEYEHDDGADNDEELTSESENDSSDTEEESDAEIVLTLSDAYQEPRKSKQCKATTKLTDSGRNGNIELDELVYTNESLCLYQGTALDFVEQLQ